MLIQQNIRNIIKYKLNMLRNETIKYTTKLKKENNKEENEIKQKLNNLETKLSNEPHNTDTNDTLNLLKQQLADINEKRTNGILMRSKAEWIEGSEKNSKYFSNLEKRNAEKKNIAKLIQNNKEINKTADILKETKKFYENIYKKKNNILNSDTFFEKIKLK